MSNAKIQIPNKDKVGYIDTGALPAEGGCNLLCLTDRQLHIINCFVFPYATWRTRIVTTVHGELVETDDVPFDAIQEELVDLDLQINGGATMSCDSIATAISELAAALAAGGAGGGATATASCGGPMGALGGALSAMEDGDFIPEEATEPPTEPTPPEGFDDWAEYLLWKCKAAQAVWLEVDRFLMTMQGLGGVEIGVATVAPIIAGFVGASFATMGPVGLVVVVASILAVLAYGVSTLLIVSQLRDWWTDHKIEIVCELYESGDAADALAAIGAFIEDAFQAVTWGAELAPFQTQIKGFLGTALGKLETNSLVNPLFKLVTGVALLEFECPCEQEADTGWHFDEWEEFWVASTYGDPIVVVSNEWSPNPWPPDYLDSSPGCISTYLNPPAAGTYPVSGGSWLYTYPAGTGPICASTLWGVRYNVYNTDFSHGYECRLYYEDDTYDIGSQGQKEWTTWTVYTTAPNVGKRAARIRIRLYNNANGHVDGWMRVDNVRLQEW